MLMIHPQWALSFQHLVALGSFTKAAEQLDLTQAAVSQHIRHLENQYGTLLIRHARRIELTPAGEAMQAYCQALEIAQQRLNAQIGDGQTDSGTMTLISPGSVGLRLYPLLLDFQADFPSVHISHRFAPDSDVIEAVINKQTELGFVTFKPDSSYLMAQPFTQEALELVVPADVQVTDWEDLQQLGFMDHPDGKAMATRLLSRRFPGNPGFSTLPIHGFTNQISLILEPVARGFGFTVLPRYAREAFSKSSAIKPLPYDQPIVDTLWLIHRAEWPLSALAMKVVDYLQRLLSQRIRPPEGGRH